MPYQEFSHRGPSSGYRLAAWNASRCPLTGNPGQGERDSGMNPNSVPDDPEQDSGMRVNTGSAMKPNSFRPIPEWCSASPE